MHRMQAMTVRPALVVLSLLAAACVPRAYAADGIESIARITEIARATAAASTGRPAAELEVAPIDVRLRLPECEATPAGHLAPGSRSPAQLTIEVRCRAPVWRQYVAVRVRAEEPVVIATRPLSRLQVVGADDVTVVPRDLASLPGGYYRRAEDVLGHIAQRNIGAGEILDPHSARAPPLVRRGQTVTLIVRSGGLSVHAAGVVLGDAGLDERVSVRNSATSRMLQGVVRSSETVEVLLE
jgi:flagellar basal body P-ring formation protein FlgA